MSEDDVHHIPEEGILFYSDLRDHGLYTGQNDASNVSKQMKELREANLLIRIYKGRWSNNSLYLMPKRVMEEMDQGGDTSAHTYTSTTYTSFSVFDFYVVNRDPRESPPPFQQLVWIQKPTQDRPGLRDNHKLLIKRVLLGGIRDVDELVESFGMCPKNFKSRVLKAPIEMGLLEYEDEPQNGRLRIPENFEDVLRQVYFASGGEEALKRAQERFSNDRENDRKRRAEAANVEGPELSAPLEETLGRLGMTMDDWQKMDDTEQCILFWSWAYHLAATA